MLEEVNGGGKKLAWVMGVGGGICGACGGAGAGFTAGAAY